MLILIKKWKGGVGSVVASLSKELQNRGHVVEVISREEDMKINSMIKSIAPIRRLVCNHESDYDLIYTQDWSMAFPLIFPTRLCKKKHFCCFHGKEDSSLPLILQKMVGKILGRRLIVVGDGLKEMFPESNLNYNGVDFELFKPLRKKIIKGSVGFVNWKNEEYRYQEIKDACTALRKKLIIAENISRRKMPEFYGKIETLISLPPKYTGFGLTWIEAMGCNVQKIIGNNNGIGSKIEIDKVENFKNIEEALKKARPQNYRKKVIKKFSLKNNVDRLLKIMDIS